MLVTVVCTNLSTPSSVQQLWKHCTTFSTLTERAEVLFWSWWATCTAQIQLEMSSFCKMKYVFQALLNYLLSLEFTFIHKPQQSYKDMTTSFFSLPNTSWCDNIKLTVWVGLFSASPSFHEILSERHIINITGRPDNLFEVLTWVGTASGLSVCRAVTSRCPGLRPSLRRA